MKFLIYLVVFLLLLNDIKTNKVADSIIQDSCKRVSEYKNPNYYKFCIASIKENPKSQNVKSIIELTVVAVKNARSNMTNVKEIVDKILKERKYKNKSSETVLRDCLKWYNEGTDLLTKALEYIKLWDEKRVFDSISYARDVPKSCEVTFKSQKQTSPVTKENNVLYELVDIPQIILITMPT